MRCRRSLFIAFPVPPHAAAFERGCRHPFLSVPPRAATDAATHFYRCHRVPPLMPPHIFIGAAACCYRCRHPCLSVPRAASLSSAKREVKREAKKCGMGARRKQTSSGSLVRSLVVGTAADSEQICIAPGRILRQGAGSFHSGLRPARAHLQRRLSYNAKCKAFSPHPAPAPHLVLFNIIKPETG